MKLFIFIYHQQIVQLQFTLLRACLSVFSAAILASIFCEDSLPFS